MYIIDIYFSAYGKTAKSSSRENALVLAPY